jgi:tetratricopeptide (TPR) repeat protein
MTSSPVEPNHRRAQAVIREAILSTEVILFDAHGRPITGESLTGKGELAKIRTELHRLIDDHLAKVSPEDLKHADKLIAAFQQLLARKKNDKYVFDVTKGELSISVFDGNRWGAKYTISIYKILAALGSVAALQVHHWFSWPEVVRVFGSVDIVRLSRILADYRLSGKLDQRVKAIGPDHSDTIQPLTNLAIDLSRLGLHKEAEKLDRRALGICEKTLGPDHPDTAQPLTNLAIDLSNLGQYEEAEKLDRRALAIREKALGPEHPGTASSLFNLAIDLSNLDRHEEAEKLDRRALAIREKALGPEHYDTALSLNYLAIDLRQLGRYEEAENFDRRALGICEKTLGPEHPDTVSSLFNLARDLRQGCVATFPGRGLIAWREIRNGHPTSNFQMETIRARDHSLCGTVVSSILAVLPGCRGTPGGARSGNGPYQLNNAQAHFHSGQVCNEA